MDCSIKPNVLHFAISAERITTRMCRYNTISWAEWLDKPNVACLVYCIWHTFQNFTNVMFYHNLIIAIIQRDVWAKVAGLHPGSRKPVWYSELRKPGLKCPLSWILLGNLGLVIGSTQLTPQGYCAESQTRGELGILVWAPWIKVGVKIWMFDHQIHTLQLKCIPGLYLLGLIFKLPFLAKQGLGQCII